VKYGLQEVAHAIQGKLKGDPDLLIRGVSTDTRTIQPGSLFFAIPGSNFDGADFVDQAFRSGAAACVIPEGREAKGPCIQVDDTVRALGRFSVHHRVRLPDMRIVAITGSLGKSTTREIAGTILSSRFRTVRGIKSYNNRIGVPLTLLRAEEDTEVLVVELGSNHPGEMAELSSLVRADLGVLTRVARVHLEFLSDLNGVAREKSALFASLREGGIAVLNADSPKLDLIRSAVRSGVRTVTYALEASADFRADSLALQEDRSTFRLEGHAVEVPMPGRGSAEDALAALTVAHLLGVPLDEGARALRGFRPLPMRMERISLDGIDVVNDAYNSSPDAVVELLRSFQESDTCRLVFVLGDMLELGENSADLHREIGRRFTETGHHILFTLGENARYIAQAARDSGADHVHHASDLDSLADDLIAYLKPGDLLLLKASRGIGLERLIPLIEKRIR
jgi:UDP-N-acetylmuramoyl-tripeptide--D-alanyl-D-alanine ligase